MAFWAFPYIANILQILAFCRMYDFSIFQEIRLGCCTVAAHRAHSEGLEPATF